MNFVFEELSVEDEQKYDWSLFKGWWGNLQYSPGLWVIDRQKEIFFIRVSGPPRESDEWPIYGVYWQGHVISFQALYQSLNGDFKVGVDSVWHFKKIKIPADFPVDFKKLREALSLMVSAWPVVYGMNVIKKSLVVNFEGE